MGKGFKTKILSPKESRTQLGNLRYLDQLRPLARINRVRMSESENVIWQRIRRNSLGYRFLRQKPIGRFILDFYCSKLLLAIEIDGGYHLKQKHYDLGRDELLFSRGVLTVRFTNEEIALSVDEAIKRLKGVIQKREVELEIKPHPGPPLDEREGVKKR